jgi:ACS family D-galactonate transporter-like MFS transporter
MRATKIYPWIVVGLLWGVALLNYMDRQMLSTMRPAMQGDIRELQSAANFGYLMGIFLWVYGIMSPFAGMIADALNRKWLIVGSLFVWSGVTLAMGYATSFHQLYWLRAVMGISEALYIPAGLSLITDYHRDGTRSLAVGIHMTGLYLGQAIGGFGASVAAYSSWQKAFHSFGIIGILYSLVLIAFLREARLVVPIKRTDKRPSGIKELFGSIPFRVILFYFAISSLPGWATKNWLPTLFAQHLHLPMSEAGPLSTITIAVSSLLGVICGGLLSDNWVRKNIRGRIYSSAIGLFLMIPSLLLMGFGHSLFFLLAAAICFGLGYGIFDANNMPIICQFVSNRHRATAYGMINLTGVLSGAVITDVLGNYSDKGLLGEVFALLAGLVVMAVTSQLYFLRPTVSDLSADDETVTNKQQIIRIK